MKANDGRDLAGPSLKHAAATPITAAVAARVRALRTAADMSGGKLAAKLEDLGVAWNRTTLAKFETGARRSISVEELLALSLALGVPPAMLLADPRAVAEVPLAEDVTVPAWDALRWMVGREALHVVDVSTAAADRNYSDAMAVIHAGWEIAEATLELTNREVRWAGSDELTLGEADRRDAARHRAALVRINASLSRLRSIGAPEPPLDPSVLARAKELDQPLLPKPRD